MAIPNIDPVAAQTLLGASPQIRGVIDQIERVAPTEASVLIIGESGSGKELVARSIHDHSHRSAGPFVAINCGAIASGLIEAEMFGHEKGSFTGAHRAHEGVFERANGGTLFLDEVTEMPCELQVRLLRVLETGGFFRVGGSRELSSNVRIVSATNRCPLAAVRDHKMREDVLYRLAVFPIELPPLRDRVGDVELLAKYFLDVLNQQANTSKRLSLDSIQRMRSHSWPGNVRELRNAVERAYILADSELQVSPMTSSRRDANCDSRDVRIAVGARLQEAERTLIEATLQHFDGNKRQAAKSLGCSLKTLYNKVNGYNHECDVGELRFAKG